MYIEAFTTHFGELSDTRQSAKVTYPLEDILFITLCGVVAGAEGWSEIRDYADGHIDWFQQHGYLRDGVPVDDTIARTVSRIFSYLIFKVPWCQLTPWVARPASQSK